MRRHSRVIAPSAARAGDPAGLTLLEVLISMAILGIGLAVIMQGLAQGVRLRRDSTDDQRMSLVAENRLNLLLAGEEAPSEAEEGEEGGYRWSLQNDPSLLPGNGGEGDLVPVRITVKGNYGRSLEIVTLMPRGSGER